jgi:hypothetical protein
MGDFRVPVPTVSMERSYCSGLLRMSSCVMAIKIQKRKEDARLSRA